jgi:hypothetical protein
MHPSSRSTMLTARSRSSARFIRSLLLASAGGAEGVLQVGPRHDIAQLVVVRARRRHLRVAPAPEPVGAHLLGKLLDRVDPVLPDLLGESVRHDVQTANKRAKGIRLR